ncbi:H-NS histone family protein [Caballeronia sordidicola]|uniref:H-NS histone family protein n=1 Tax=Caballeronia sordidicola TaxID=196367 RepID=UPI002286ACC8|nr:H-NS histone family protein [Caballeronia sordidicola]
MSEIETNCIKRCVPLLPSSITRFRNHKAHGIVRAITLKETIMPTLEQIQAKLKKLQAQAEAMIAKRAQSVLDDIRKLMETHGLSTADIDAHSSTKKPRGRPAGKTSKPGVKAKAKAKAAAKPKLPAKYRNPKTGDTWSGWARPPLWIKDVKDRTKFLIDGHSESHAVATSATRPASKKAAKKVTAKKATVKTLSAKAPAKKATAKKASAKSATAANVPAEKAAAKKAPVKRAYVKKTSAAKKSATVAGTTTPAANQDSASAVALTSAI